MQPLDVVIRAEDLSKRYGERQALWTVSLEICAGETVGLLGPNGAGKTTTLSILAGTLKPDSGWVSICHQDLVLVPTESRRHLGLVPQSIALYPSLTAWQNLMFFGRVQGLSTPAGRDAATSALEEVGLADRADETVASFSGGMKRRLNLACGILHRPDALLLDEPTLGVDPQSRERIFAVVESAKKRGAAILYSTHYMEEVERLCDRIILIDGGKIAARGTAAQLIAIAGAEPYIDLTTDTPLSAGWSGGLDGIREHDGDSNGVVHVTIARLDLVPEVMRRAQQAGGALKEFHLHRPNLQDAFIKLTGHGLRDQ